MRAGLVVAVVVLGAGLRVAGAQAALQEQIVRMVNEPAVAGAHWGVAVWAMDGTPLVGLNEGRLFQPASNEKLLTTAAAMDLLGPEATVATRVVAAGPVVEGVLTGDLVVEGAGDGAFGAEDVPYVTPAAAKARRAAEAVAGSAEAEAKAARAEHPLRDVETLADAVVAAGLKVVTGDVVGDDAVWAWEPYPEAWGVDDLLWGYGAPVGALTVHENQLQVRARPGSVVGGPGTVEVEAGLPAWYTVDAAGLRTVAAKSGTRVAMDRAVGTRVLRIWGTIAADAPEQVEEVAIDDPAEFAARALREMLVARGVEVRGAARARHRLPLGTKGFLAESREPLALPAGAVGSGQMAGAGQVLGTVTSPALAEDERLTNKVSQNLHAELLLERLGAAFGAGGVEAGSRAEGARVVRSWLTGRVGIGAAEFVQLDGSGLSMHDLVTPRALARLLVWSAGQPWGAAWRATLPVAGEDGSLAGRFGAGSPVQGMLAAKTGTLGEARALSGYLRCASGRTVVVSVMVENHLPGNGAVDRAVMDRVVEAVFAAE